MQYCYDEKHREGDSLEKMSCLFCRILYNSVGYNWVWLPTSLPSTLPATPPFPLPLLLCLFQSGEYA